MGVRYMWNILDENIESWKIFKSINVVKLFKNKKIMITGATGLIGKALVNTFLEMNRVWNLKIKIYCVVRNANKAKKIWNDYKDNLIFIEKDLSRENMNDITDKVDYILHTAAITDSSSFVNKPVETILIGLQGINNVLDYAYKNEIQSVVFLSSMEVYGEGFGLKEIDGKYDRKFKTVRGKK